MKTITNVLLGSAIISLAIGLAINSGVAGTIDSDALYTILPLGAVLFGLFLIVKVLGKESLAYDAEHQHEAKAGAPPRNH